eukprot:2017371-Rhodomonas_salina.2
MSGTDLGYAATRERVTSPTVVAVIRVRYGCATRCPVLRECTLRLCYAMSSSAIGYAAAGFALASYGCATRCPVLRWGMLLRQERNADFDSDRAGSHYAQIFNGKRGKERDR